VTGAPPDQRVDKWLWHARFFRTRTLAAKVVADGVRINGVRIDRPAALVRPGDVLTFAQGSDVRVIEVAAIGLRRGPAPEAHGLYLDRTPPMAPPAGPRPTKRDRRAMDALRDPDP